MNQLPASSYQFPATSFHGDNTINVSLYHGRYVKLKDVLFHLDGEFPDTAINPCYNTTSVL
mgnify:FL=1